MNRSKHFSIAFLAVVTLMFGVVLPVLAQSDQPQAASLIVYTPYPSQTVDFDETLSFDLILKAGNTPQLVDLEIEGLPDTWTSSFRGGGNIISSVYVVPDEETTVQLQLVPVQEVEAGTYQFKVIADGEQTEVELPISLTFEERAPASLEASADLPTVRGRPDTTFRYNLTLDYTGEEPVQVDLVAVTPEFLIATFKSSGQEVSSVPFEANQTKRIDVEVSSLVRGLPAGDYPIEITAGTGELSATTTLIAEVVGQPDLIVTTPDGRLSGSAELGKQTAITLVLANQGSAPARGIQLSSTKPSGWEVEFSPERVDEIQPGQQVEVTANVQPSEQAIAGDYQLTFRATPQDSQQKSADYRVTVETSTMWGIVGIGLIAAAVVIVGLSVQRFGRR